MVVLVEDMSHELLVWGNVKGCQASAIEGPRGRKDLRRGSIWSRLDGFNRNSTTAISNENLYAEIVSDSPIPNISRVT